MGEKWSYNSNADYWGYGEYDSKEDAIAAGRENLKSDEPDFYCESSHFNVGKIVPIVMKSIDAENMILEPIAEDLYDDHEQAGENAFTKISSKEIKELEEQLQSVFDTRIKKYDCDPAKGYFHVIDIEEVPF